MKKSFVSFIVCLIAFLAATLFWVMSSVPKRAHQYLEESPKPLSILAALEFIQIRDMPGYAGALGRHDAKDAATSAMENEVDAWKKMTFIGYRLTKDTMLSQCVNNIHVKKLSIFSRSAKYATQTLTPVSDVNELFDDEKDISRLTHECMALALTADDWLDSAWNNTTEFIASALEALKKQNTANANIEQLEHKNPVEQESTDNAISTQKPNGHQSNGQLKFVQFDGLKKVNFNDLTDAQKKFLQSEGAPISDEGIYEGGSTAVRRPAILKIENKSLLVTSFMNSGIHNSTTDFSFYDLDNLSVIDLRGIDEEVSDNVQSVISFGMKDNVFIGIYKIQIETTGRIHTSDHRCFNEGLIISLNPTTKTFKSPQPKSLGNDCPAIEENTTNSVETADRNAAKHDQFIEKLFHNLASAQTTTSKNYADFPEAIVEECKGELKKYLVAKYGALTKENQYAINRNCTTINPKGWICFTKGVSDNGGDISRVDEGYLKVKCGLI